MLLYIIKLPFYNKVLEFQNAGKILEFFSSNSIAWNVTCLILYDLIRDELTVYASQFFQYMRSRLNVKVLILWFLDIGRLTPFSIKNGEILPMNFQQTILILFNRKEKEISETQLIDSSR